MAMSVFRWVRPCCQTSNTVNTNIITWVQLPRLWVTYITTLPGLDSLDSYICFKPRSDIDFLDPLTKITYVRGLWGGLESYYTGHISVALQNLYSSYRVHAIAGDSKARIDSVGLRREAQWSVRKGEGGVRIVSNRRFRALHAPPSSSLWRAGQLLGPY